MGDSGNITQSDASKPGTKDDSAGQEAELKGDHLNGENIYNRLVKV